MLRLRWWRAARICESCEIEPLTAVGWQTTPTAVGCFWRRSAPEGTSVNSQTLGPLQRQSEERAGHGNSGAGQIHVVEALGQGQRVAQRRRAGVNLGLGGGGAA